jgi:hypothetical protein
MWMRKTAAAAEFQDGYLDLRALSVYSCLSVRTLRSYVTDPIDPLPSYCIRRKILVRKMDFDRWVMNHKNKPQELSSLVDEVLAGVL